MHEQDFEGGFGLAGVREPSGILDAELIGTDEGLVDVVLFIVHDLCDEVDDCVRVFRIRNLRKDVKKR
jgi:hypothetical protein